MSTDAIRHRQTAEASEWLIRLREEPDDESMLTSWLRWCESDPGNAQAFQRVQSLWRQMDAAYPGDRDIDQALHQTTRSGGSRQATGSRQWRPLRKFARPLAVAAACALIALLLGRGVFNDSAPALTVAKQNRASLLPDGSAVELSAQTSVAVNFSAAKRVLKLSPGEAYFKVEPDKRRPFTVRAGDIEVTAVGTAFDVKRQAHSITVTVQEGVVEVNAVNGTADRTPSVPWRVASGYQFVYSDSEGTATLSSVDTSSVLAWRDGRWEYTRTPLADVLADVNRYAEHAIVITDPAIGQLTFTGTVFAASIDDWVSALPGALPVTVQRTRDGRVLLLVNTAGITAGQ